MSDLAHDVRHALQSLRHRPAFAGLVVVTLALAIGINTAIFSLVGVYVFGQPPFADGETLGVVRADNAGLAVQDGGLSMAELIAVRESVGAFSEVGAYTGVQVVLSGADEPVRVFGARTTADLLDVWRVRPELGRGFAPGEDAPGAERVAILSHGFWQRRFGADPRVLGSTVEIDGHPTTVVGVMPETMEWGNFGSYDVWLPLTVDPANAVRAPRNLAVIGRLAPGATHEQADEELRALFARLADQYPETNAGWIGKVKTLRENLASPGEWTLVYMLGLTVAFVLLIACSNVATLMLARGAARSSEIAVREALGAARGRIVRQLLIEGLLLSIASGLLGLAVARGAFAGLIWTAGGNASLRRFFEMLSLDARTLGFTLGVSVAAPLLFGLWPALRATRLRLAESLKAGARGLGDGSSLRGQRVLVGFQVALALTLLVVSAAFLTSMAKVYALDLGYDPEELVAMDVYLPEGQYPEADQQRRFFERALADVRAEPGVEGASWVSRRPIVGGSGRTGFRIEGRPEPEPERAPWAGVVTVAPDYFRLLNLDVLRGRGLQSSDRPDAPPVVVVNRAAAERWWPGEEPVGQRLRLEADAAPGGDGWIEVVGVVESEVRLDPAQPTRPEIYLPVAQRPRPALTLVVRSRGEPTAVVPGVRARIWALDSDQPVADVLTLEEVIRNDMAGWRAVLALFGVFAVFALVMASAGIYAVLSFAVTRRTREIGIRSALGARADHLVRTVVGQSAVVVAIGLACGLAAGYGLSRVLAAALPELTVAGLPIQAGSALVLGTVALAAAWLPASRVTRIDPVEALRLE